jgi:hypothetical protein
VGVFAADPLAAQQLAPAFCALAAVVVVMVVMMVVVL